jgi:hypothetical protein
LKPSGGLGDQPIIAITVTVLGLVDDRIWREREEEPDAAVVVWCDLDGEDAASKITVDGDIERGMLEAIAPAADIETKGKHRRGRERGERENERRERVAETHRRTPWKVG